MNVDMYVSVFFSIYLLFLLILLVVNEMNDKYLDIVDKYTPKEDRLKNAILTFVVGGLIGVLGELLLRGYMIWFNLPRKESGIIVTLTFVVVASILTAVGIFDVFVAKFKNWFCSFDDCGSVRI